MAVKKLPVKKVVRLPLLNEDKKLLLGRQKERRLWHLIGGQVKEGEDPVEALKREVQQEANITCHKLKLLHTEIIKWPDHTEIIHCYSGQAKNPDQMKPDGKEIDALGWVSIHNTRKLRLTDTTRLLLQNISIIGLFV